jgi:CRP-like cAMP-binding protein
MYNCPRTATISARTDCVLWSLDRTSFRRVLLQENSRKARLYETFLEKVPLLEPLSKEQRNRMVDALEGVSFAVGETIIEQGAEGTHFFVIEAGEARAATDARARASEPPTRRAWRRARLTRLALAACLPARTPARARFPSELRSP